MVGLKGGEGRWDQPVGGQVAGWELKDYGRARGSKLKMRRNPPKRILI